MLCLLRNSFRQDVRAFCPPSPPAPSTVVGKCTGSGNVDKILHTYNYKLLTVISEPGSLWWVPQGFVSLLLISNWSFGKLQCPLLISVQFYRRETTTIWQQLHVLSQLLYCSEHWTTSILWINLCFSFACKGSAGSVIVVFSLLNLHADLLIFSRFSYPPLPQKENHLLNMLPIQSVLTLTCGLSCRVQGRHTIVQLEGAHHSCLLWLEIQQPFKLSIWTQAVQMFLRMSTGWLFLCAHYSLCIMHTVTCMLLLAWCIMLVAFRCFELCSVDVCHSMSVLGE